MSADRDLRLRGSNRRLIVLLVLGSKRLPWEDQAGWEATWFKEPLEREGEGTDESSYGGRSERHGEFTYICGNRGRWSSSKGTRDIRAFAQRGQTSSLLFASRSECTFGAAIPRIS